MCGIFAIFAGPGRRLPDDASPRLERALAAIRHRGPDASGVHVDPEGRWGVGHVRLSVIDVAAASNQPFWSSCGNHFVVFNGEIYNYVELRTELEREGVEFRTRSDTEVLLQALMRWGPGCIRRFNGMWAFVYGDMRTGQFLVCRDRWGVKPLHMVAHDGMLLVCSEAKGLFAFMGRVPSPDLGSIGQFLKYSVGGESESSWFEGVHRFPKGTFCQIDLRTLDVQQPIFCPYWQYPSRRTITSASEASDRLLATLEDAVRVRLRSDVPVGLSLSGGLDSATIAWISGERLQRPLEAYTAWYEPLERSELPMARRIASTFGHRSIPIAESLEKELLTHISTSVWHLDSGHSSPAIIPYLRLCRAARESLTVMLEGQGADELLGGYTPFELFAGVDRLLDGRPLRALECFTSFARTDGMVRMLQELVRYFSRDIYERQALRWGAGTILPAAMLDAVPGRLRRLALTRGNLDAALRLWHEDGLTNLLQYGDAISMSVNLETRCPFLDYRLVELGFSMCEDLLVDRGFGKHVLRRAVESRLPRDLVWNRRKQGFSNSTEAVLRKIVVRDGLPRQGLEIAIELGLVRPVLQDRRTVERLPPGVLFRMVTMLTWAERFYGRATDSPTGS